LLIVLGSVAPDLRHDLNVFLFEQFTLFIRNMQAVDNPFTRLGVDEAIGGDKLRHHDMQARWVGHIHQQFAQDGIRYILHRCKSNDGAIKGVPE